MIHPENTYLASFPKFITYIINYICGESYIFMDSFPLYSGLFLFFCICRDQAHSVKLLQNLMRIAAIWALVAFPVGKSSDVSVPLIRPSATAQLIASSA